MNLLNCLILAFLLFGIGVWGGMTRYTTYACPTCGTVTDNGKKVFILPDDVMVSLIYIF